MSTIEANTQQKGKNDEKKMEKEAIEEQHKKRKMASTNENLWKHGCH